jgi:HAD superfamily hydrolase (TIGR01490 family)
MRLAIFDFDGTLLRGNSWRLFFRRQIFARPFQAPAMVAGAVLRKAGLVSAEALQDRALAAWRGRSRVDIETEAKAFYHETIRPRLRAEALAELAARREEGCAPVLLSAAWDVWLKPVAEDLRISMWAGSEVAFENERCLGRLVGPLLRGEAKRDFLASDSFTHPVDWRESYAYGDEHSDAPMLSMVGRPFFVAGNASCLPAGLPKETRLLRWG